MYRNPRLARRGNAPNITPPPIAKKRRLGPVWLGLVTAAATVAIGGTSVWIASFRQCQTTSSPEKAIAPPTSNKLTARNPEPLSAATAPQIPRPALVPPTPIEQPKIKREPMPSPAEIRFAEKFQTFLDYCSGTARLLNDCNAETMTEREGKTTELYAAIPGEVLGAPWTGKALAKARELQTTTKLASQLITLGLGVLKTIRIKSLAEETRQSLDAQCMKEGEEMGKVVRESMTLIPQAMQL